MPKIVPKNAARLTAPEDYFGFSRRPFAAGTGVVRPILTNEDQTALETLCNSLRTHAQRGYIVGDVGCGKTFVARYVASQLPNTFSTVYVASAQNDTKLLLQQILHGVDVNFHVSDDANALRSRFESFIRSRNPNDAGCTLFLDEAQRISSDALQHLFDLQNSVNQQGCHLKIVLIGSMPAPQKLIAPFDKTLTLRALNEVMTNRYICHRLRAANGTGAEIDELARMCVFDVTEGCPRLVNQICDLALLYAVHMRKPHVCSEVIQQVLADGYLMGPELVA